MALILWKFYGGAVCGFNLGPSYEDGKCYADSIMEITIVYSQ